MLRYTGHPLVDVGVATIVAWSRKRSPEEVTVEDLEAVADRLESYLFNSGPLQTYLFYNSLNAIPAQNSYNPPKKPAADADEKARQKYAKQLTSFENRKEAIAHEKQKYLNEVLRGFHAPALDDTCVFSGDPAVAIVHRTQIPLLNGESIINFSPRGRPGVAICGWCLLAIHAAPLGGRKSAGRVLLIHTDQARTTQYFASQALRDNQRYLSMIGEAEDFNWPNESYPRTRLIEALQNAQSEAEEMAEVRTLVGYHITNYGPDPRVDIYTLPSAAIELLRELGHQASPVHPAWQQVVSRAWQQPKQRKGDAETPPDTGSLRNSLYEDLFDLPFKARDFVSRYLLPPRRLEAWMSLPNGSFALVELFFRKVMSMRQEKVNAIRTLGDRLALYIQHRDRRLFNDLHFAKSYRSVCLALLRAARDGWSPDDEPLLPMDTFIEVFEGGDTDYADIDWWLGRDVVMLRVCESLQRAGWFASNRDYVEGIKEHREES